MEKLSDLSFLVVADNQHMLSILRVLLRAYGVRDVRECLEGNAAFEQFRASVPDIVIVDYQMMPMNGVDFVRLVRRCDKSPNPYVPVIMLTAHSKTHCVVEAREAGVTEILVKPVTAKDLLARIHAVIYYPRPFINAATYFGPCRRRKQDGGYDGPERRKKPAVLIEKASAVAAN